MPLFGWRGDLAKFFRDPIGILTRLQRTYGSVVALSRTSSRWIAAFGPEHNQRLLSEPDVFHMDPIPIPESVNAFETAGWEI
jgi:hypothetical protein